MVFELIEGGEQGKGNDRGRLRVVVVEAPQGWATMVNGGWWRGGTTRRAAWGRVGGSRHVALDTPVGLISFSHLLIHPGAHESGFISNSQDSAGALSLLSASCAAAMPPLPCACKAAAPPLPTSLLSLDPSRPGPTPFREDGQSEHRIWTNLLNWWGWTELIKPHEAELMQKRTPLLPKSLLDAHRLMMDSKIPQLCTNSNKQENLSHTPKVFSFWSTMMYFFAIFVWQCTNWKAKMD